MTGAKNVKRNMHHQEKCVDIPQMPVLGTPSLSENQTCGVVAQLGERLNGIQEAASSILASSTIKKRGVKRELGPYFFMRP
jgi:hypothetical protein